MMKEIIYPKKIEKGATIAVISPAGAVEEAQMQAGLEMLSKKGYNIELGKHLYGKYNHGYGYSGTPEERAADLNWALNDPDIDAIWVSRGGYGCQHLIQDLDLKGFRKKPKWFIGYSDNTVLQSVLYRQGFASIHGQSIKMASFGVHPDAYTRTFKILNGKLPAYKIKKNKNNRKGRAEGTLVGGNLALIYALLATKYSYDFNDRILFIEDIGEQYYALDRMLSSLELAGVFSNISGVIVGGMTNIGDEKSNKFFAESYDEFAYELIAERLDKYDFPIMFGFPNGHIYDNFPLIIGGRVTLEVGEKNLLEFH